MEFGREVFGVPGNVTQPVSFAPNQLIKQGAQLVTNGADVIEELPTPVRAALVQAEQPEAEQRNLLAAASLQSKAMACFVVLLISRLILGCGESCVATGATTLGAGTRRPSICRTGDFLEWNSSLRCNGSGGPSWYLARNQVWA